MDFDRPNAWRYRDYVIRSFNKDTPYNVFLAEQIGGDELDWVTDDSLIATGFLRSYAKVGFREKDNPDNRYELSRRYDRHHRARSPGADRYLCSGAATITSSIRFRRRIITRCRRRCSGMWRRIFR